ERLDIGTAEQALTGITRSPNPLVVEPLHISIRQRSVKPPVRQLRPDECRREDHQGPENDHQANEEERSQFQLIRAQRCAMEQDLVAYRSAEDGGDPENQHRKPPHSYVDETQTSDAVGMCCNQTKLKS